MLEVDFRIIFYPAKQRSVLEKLPLKIPAMQNQRKSPSAPNLLGDIAVAIQMMVKAAAAGERSFCQFDVFHEAISCQGHAGTLKHAELWLQMLLESRSEHYSCVSEFLLWGQGFAPFPKLLIGNWHVKTQSLRAQVSWAAKWYRGEGKKQHKFYLCSPDRLLLQQNSSFITFFFPGIVPSVLLKGNMQIH